MRSGSLPTWLTGCCRLLILSVLLLLPAVGEARGLFIQRPVATFLEAPQWDLNLGYHYNTTEVSSAGNTFRASSQRFSEGFTLRTRGWTYHPALIHYNLRISPSWQQRQRRDFDGNRTSGQQARLLYRIDGTLLALKPYATNFFAEQTSVTTTSAQGLDTEVDRTRYGASLSLPWGRDMVPTKLRYRHQTLERQRLGTSSRSSSDFWSLDSRHEVDRSATFLYASYNTSSSGQGDQFQTTTSQLQNTLFLTEDGTMQLRSLLSGNWDESSFGSRRERYRLEEDWRWVRQHAHNFSTTYNARYLHQRFDGQADNSYELGATLEHRLYENLATSIHVSARRFTSQFTENDHYGGRFAMNYSRRIPTGSVTLNMAESYRISKSSVMAHDFDFTDPNLRSLSACFQPGAGSETCTFRLDAHEAEEIDLETVTLRLLPPPFDPEAVDPRPDELVIDRDSYLVYEFRNPIEIELRADFIEDFVSELSESYRTGWTLEISYEVRLRPGYDSVTRVRSYGGHLEFLHHWAIHYRAERSKEHFLSGTRPENLFDVRSYTTGISWTRPLWQGIVNSSFDYTETTFPTSLIQEQHVKAGFARSVFGGAATMRNNAGYKKITSDVRFALVSEDDGPAQEAIFVEEINEYHLSTALDLRLRANRTLTVQGGYDSTTLTQDVRDLTREEKRDAFSLGANMRVRQGLNARLNGRWTRSEVSATGRKEERLRLASQITQQFGQRNRTRLNLDGIYEKKTTNLPQESQLYVVGMGYQYRFRIVSFSANYRFRHERQPFNDTRATNHAISLSLSRALN